MNAPNNSLIKSILRERRAVPVHFATVMADYKDFRFPKSLLNALTLTGEALSFATIQPGDKFCPLPGKESGAPGSVGILVDVGPETTVESVCPEDSGSSELGSFGKFATAENCAESIDKRTTSNEWRIRDYQPLGIMVLEPIVVPVFRNIDGAKIPDEISISFEEAIEPFTDQRIFSVNESGFHEFVRGSGWSALSYNEIMVS